MNLDLLGWIKGLGPFLKVGDTQRRTFILWLAQGRPRLIYLPFDKVMRKADP
jgi:hypothetical protein